MASEIVHEKKFTVVDGDDNAQKMKLIVQNKDVSSAFADLTCISNPFCIII
jgi:hypothetical protein